MIHKELQHNKIHEKINHDSRERLSLKNTSYGFLASPLTG